MDIVMPYRKSSSNEIVWAIKSFVKNLPHRNIYVIGDDPKLDGVTHIEPDHNPWYRNSKYHNQINSYLTACKLPFVSRQFIAVNDDFFVLSKWKPVIYNRGSISEHMRLRTRRDEYHRSLDITRRYLESRGFSTLDYELHTPFIFDRYKLKALVNSLSMEPWRMWQIRSLYGNVYKVKSQFTQDVKNPVDYKDKPLLSTSDATFTGEIGSYIRSKLV